MYRLACIIFWILLVLGEILGIVCRVFLEACRDAMCCSVLARKEGGEFEARGVHLGFLFLFFTCDCIRLRSWSVVRAVGH